MSGQAPSPPAAVLATLDRWLLKRGFTLAALLAVGCEVRRVDRFGWALVWPYRFSNGEPAPERLLVLQGKAALEWRWAGGGAKGAVMVLGDPRTARLLIIAEGESCGLAAWLRRPDDVAVIVIPGANMVGDDLANFVGNGARVVIATDADQGGDRCAVDAAQALAAAGVEPELIRRLRPTVEGLEAPDLRDLLVRLDYTGRPDVRSAFGQLLADAPPALAEEPPTEGGGDEWPQPTPLRGPERPAFPVLSVLSDGRRWITAAAASTQTPIDLAGMIFLGTLAAAVRGRCEIEVREGWREPLTLYVATILPSGEGKSPVVSQASRPLLDLEREIAEEFRREVAQGQALYRSAQKRLEKAERDAAKEEGPDRYAAEEKVRTLADELAGMTYPEIPRILADDATPEALVSLLAAHERIAVISAEGGIFDVLAGRYSDGVANLDGVLKAWDGEAIRVDRRGRETEHVERPILAQCLAIQPQVLETLRDKPAMRGRGLAARFLYSIPETILGRRALDPEPMALEVAETWSRMVRELARPSDRADRTPPALALSPGARQLHTAFRAEIEPRLHPDTGDLYELSDWTGKLAGNVARIAGLLHLAEHSWAGSDIAVSVQTMAAAVAIGNYLIPHAQAALASPGRDISRAQAILRWLRKAGIREVSVRDVQRALGSGGGFPDAGSVQTALGVLEDHGYVRGLERPRPGPQGGRPPSPRYAIHPGLSDDAGAES